MSYRIEVYPVPRTNKLRARYVCEVGHATFSVPVRDGDQRRAVARVQREIDEMGENHMCGVINCPSAEVSA